MSLISPSEFLSVAMFCDTIAIDTETNGLDIRDGRGYCVGASSTVRYKGELLSAYFPVAHYEDNVDQEIKQLLFHLYSTRDRVVLHNAKFDLLSIRTAGFTQEFIRWYCTMMMAHMLNENIPKGLDWLARNELKIEGKIKKDFKGLWNMGLGHMIPVAEMEEYAIQDTEILYQLFERLYPYFVESGFDGTRV